MQAKIEKVKSFSAQSSCCSSCRSRRDLDAYLASPACGQASADSVGSVAASAVHWVGSARLAPPTAPGAGLFCAVAVRGAVLCSGS